ncbi:MAG: tRNA (N6-threonylcarbamoyladenosine(37)-N6)-methyltransferase TrmO [Dehalococcoidia bacterium]|nr:tRNA (N6-threonylcarbamoyladenosine(37)-N6)-methyltransferase TrmO [Dehalococcoidia bacterium]
MTEEINIKPIGVVRNAIKNKEHHGWNKIKSEITVNKKFVPCLDGLQEFSHIIVFFWLHQVTPEERATKRARPLRQSDIPEMGIFAWHSSRRPNPIGMTIVKLHKIEGDKVTVQGLDAIEGTPVLDLRPYLEKYYHVDNLKEPPWVNEVMGHMH